MVSLVLHHLDGYPEGSPWPVDKNVWLNSKGNTIDTTVERFANVVTQLNITLKQQNISNIKLKKTDSQAFNLLQLNYLAKEVLLM